jgi:hypothetical protein
LFTLAIVKNHSVSNSTASALLTAQSAVRTVNAQAAQTITSMNLSEHEPRTTSSSGTLLLSSRESFRMNYKTHLPPSFSLLFHPLSPSLLAIDCLVHRSLPPNRTSGNTLGAVTVANQIARRSTASASRREWPAQICVAVANAKTRAVAPSLWPQGSFSRLRKFAPLPRIVTTPSER